MSSSRNDLHGAYRAALLVALAGACALGGCGATPVTPRLDAVTPAKLCGGVAGTLTLDGSGFAPRVRRGLGAATIDLPRVTAARTRALDGSPAPAAPVALPARWLSADALEATLATDALDAGAYDLTVTNPDGAAATLPAAFTRELPAPRIDTVTPTLLCRSGGTVTARGDGFLDGAVATLADPGGGMTLDAAATTVASATELTASFGALPFAAGTKLTLTVANPDGCSGAQSAAVMVKAGGGGCP